MTEEKQQGFFGKIGKVASGVFLTEEEPETPKTATMTHLPTNLGSSTLTSPGFPVFPVSVPGMTPERIAELDSRFKEFLANQIKNDGANLIQEVIDTAETLVEAIPDERLRIKAAIKLLAKRGASVPAILADFEKRLKTLDDAKRTVETNAANDLTNKIAASEQEVKNFDLQIQQNESQVSALMNQNATLKNQRSEKIAAIQTERTKVEQGQSRFIAVFNETRNQIQSARDRVAQFAQEG